MRKEEKKGERMRQKQEKEFPHDDHVLNLLSKGYDPHTLREQR